MKWQARHAQKRKRKANRHSSDEEENKGKLLDKNRQREERSVLPDDSQKKDKQYKEDTPVEHLKIEQNQPHTPTNSPDRSLEIIDTPDELIPSTPIIYHKMAKITQTTPSLSKPSSKKIIPKFLGPVQQSTQLSEKEEARTEIPNVSSDSDSDEEDDLNDLSGLTQAYGFQGGNIAPESASTRTTITDNKSDTLSDNSDNDLEGDGEDDTYVKTDEEYTDETPEQTIKHLKSQHDKTKKMLDLQANIIQVKKEEIKSLQL